MTFAFCDFHFAVKSFSTTSRSAVQTRNWGKKLGRLLNGGDIIGLSGELGSGKTCFVRGMAQILGKHAVIPMVTIYCFLHFGKPTGEAISSIFGGYILGVIALYTRSIWGGILIHIGVARMMEAAAYVAKQF